MIHYFNPGHETAVWIDSPFYQPPANVLKMQEDLAFLPFWYADPGDFVWVTKDLPENFESFCETLNPDVRAVISSSQDELKDQTLDLWGISKQAIHLFQRYSAQYDLNLVLPEWKDEYRMLSSRETAVACLAFLVETIPGLCPDVVPSFFSDLNEIEHYNRIAVSELLVKSPYSSSGRGLLWLEKPELSRSSRQILQGMLNRQKQVSLERKLDKILDFSMHFISDEFVGYSLFYTNAKGAYEKTWLASQEKIISRLAVYVEPELLSRVEKQLQQFIREKIQPYYQGNIGVDMMIYRSGDSYLLQPCVEINLRKSMGYLSLRLFENHLQADAEGYFSVVYDDDRTGNGIIDLCPVYSDTKYRALLTL